MEKTNITIYLTIGVLIVSIIAIFLNYTTSESFTFRLGEIKQSINEVKDTMDNSTASIEKNQLASLERDSSNFNPELKYRIFSISSEQYLPYALRAEITNTRDDHTFVKNKWTITGDICNKENEHRVTSFEFAGRNSLDLVSGKEKEVSLQLPPDFFTERLPEKTGFLVKLELEMNPFIPSIKPLGNIEFSKMTYIQYDFKEDIGSWMPTKLPSGDLNCTAMPSIYGQVFLNTSSIDDFYDHGDWWEFPEE